MDRIKVFKLILWCLTGLGFSAAVARFAFGLGVTTNLGDNAAWGFWIGFDVVSGVALAAGGFVITAIVYILKKDELHPIVKPAVLTAFLGYIAVIVGLLFDLGLPWNIWHMIVFWQHHSPLFEVGWCVMLYTTVLLLEFSPVPLEETSRYAKIRAFLMKYRLVFVILGISLSTLHQSSLGSLFLIMPYKLHALWYTPMLPVVFFLSAICLGLMMVTLESLVTSFLYRRKPETHLLAKLGKGAIYTIGIYALVRFIDLAARGNLALMFEGSRESIMFIVEIMMIIVIPLILLAMPRVRKSHAGQWAVSLLVVFGIIFNRLNVAGLSMVKGTGTTYIPSLSEILISASVVSAAALVFFFAVEHFKIWDIKAADPAGQVKVKPQFDRASQSWLGTPRVSSRVKYSLAFVLSIAVGVMFWSFDKLQSYGIDEVPVVKARGGDILLINGNRNFDLVKFDHKGHTERMGGEQSCVTCHHMNIPGDRNSECWQCHSDMNMASDAFRHDWHASPQGGKLACTECHANGEQKIADNAKTCDKCHNDLYPAGTKITPTHYMARGYVDAMHDNCVKCHEEKAVELARTELGQCASCHNQAVSDSVNHAIILKYSPEKSTWVSMPNKADKK